MTRILMVLSSLLILATTAQARPYLNRTKVTRYCTLEIVLLATKGRNAGYEYKMPRPHAFKQEGKKPETCFAKSVNYAVRMISPKMVQHYQRQGYQPVVKWKYNSPYIIGNRTGYVGRNTNKRAYETGIAHRL